MPQGRQADLIFSTARAACWFASRLGERSLARQRGKIKAGRVSVYPWLGFGLVAALGLWMFFLARYTRRQTIKRDYHPEWLWKAFMGLGVIVLLITAIGYLRWTGRF